MEREETFQKILLEEIIPFQEETFAIMGQVKKKMPLTESERKKWNILVHMVRAYKFVNAFPDVEISDVLDKAGIKVSTKSDEEPVKLDVGISLEEPTKTKTYSKEDNIPAFSKEELDKMLEDSKLISTRSLKRFNKSRQKDWYRIFKKDNKFSLELEDELSDEPENSDSDDESVVCTGERKLDKLVLRLRESSNSDEKKIPNYFS